MPILVMMEFDGFTTADYDRVDEVLRGAGRERLPDGLISHAAGVTDDGIVIVDVWESAEALERGIAEELGPAMQEAGIPPAQPTVLPVHDHLEGSGDNAEVLVIVPIEGMSTDDYDQVISRMEAHSGEGAHPSVVHIAAISDDGLVAVDIWGSVEEFQRFGEEQLAPRRRPREHGPDVTAVRKGAQLHQRKAGGRGDLTAAQPVIAWAREGARPRPASPTRPHRARRAAPPSSRTRRAVFAMPAVTGRGGRYG